MPTFIEKELVDDGGGVRSLTTSHRYQAAIPRGRHSQGPPFPASVFIFIMLMLLHTKEVLINKKLG